MIFFNRPCNYFSVNNLLSSFQFVFRSGASTEHAILKFSDDILKLCDQKKAAIATFIYLSKAFNCVDPNILLSKFKRYGVHETALQWINSYLSDREHCVSCVTRCQCLLWQTVHVHFLPNYGKAYNYPVGLLTINLGLLYLYFQFQGRDYNGMSIKLIIHKTGSNQNKVNKLQVALFDESQEINPSKILK